MEMIKGNIEWFENYYIKKLNTSDLYALFQFISVDYNKQFGTKIQAKKIIDERYKAVLSELNVRAYDGNPYALIPPNEIQGEEPTDIDLSDYDEG